MNGTPGPGEDGQDGSQTQLALTNASSQQQQQHPVVSRQPRTLQNLDDSGSGGSGGTLHCTYEGCPKTYSRREHLNRHIKLHMGIEPERPYYCLDCGKTFTRKEHLLRHRRSHTGETPYPCPGIDCPKQFARKEHLKRHMRVHTGEHPYPCSDCGRSFGRRERLLKHLKTHGLGINDSMGRITHHQPKNEPVQFKKEPEFVQGKIKKDPPPSHGVFGTQTSELLKMIARKGPVSPNELGMDHAQAQAEAYAAAGDSFHSNPEVRAALSNPDIVRAFSNPDVVKAFASPPKRIPVPPAPVQVSAPETHTPAPSPHPAPVSTPQPTVTRGPDIANSPAVPPELSKLPPTFSIFPMVQGGSVVHQGEVQTSNGYYQSAPAGYVATSMAPHRPGELTTIPMGWPTSWHMTPMQPGSMVNIRSPAKLEPPDAKSQWDGAAAAYFSARPSFP